MYGASFTPHARQTNTGSDELTARIDWLRAEAARTEPATRARREAEEVAFLMMRSPLSSPESFARFGTLLGLLPPAAVLHKIIGYDLFPLNLVMITICCVVGRSAGFYLSRQAQEETSDFRLPSWMRTLLAAVVLGFGWGVVTGAAGGVFFFGIGAFFGIFCAIPVGILGYAAFTSLHALFARNGFIEANRLWPLAFGVSGTIAALILGQ